MKNYDEEECKKFYNIAKKRMAKGYSEEAIFAGKPSGFSEWLKDTWPDRKKTSSSSNNNRFSMVRVCRFCGKKYGGTKCPYCGHR